MTDNEHQDEAEEEPVRDSSTNYSRSSEDAPKSISPERTKRAVFYLLGSEPLTVTADERDIDAMVTKLGKARGLFTVRLGDDSYTAINVSMLVRVDTSIIDERNEDE